MSEPNVEGRWESNLPDEIFINILSCLQPKDVLRCRCVMKKWRDFTSTPYFVDLHKQHGIARMILVDVSKRKGDQRGQFFLDEWWITARKKPAIQKIHCHPRYFSDFSQDGLLVMTSSCKCSHETVIVNPIFREKVKIVVSKEWHSWLGNIYGVYFNPTLKEYCALLEANLNSSIIKQPVPLGSSTVKPPITYKILTLRDIQNPYKDRCPTSALEIKRPTMVDRFIYWMIDLEGNEYSDYGDIMEFDTRSDEFKLMRCPAPVNDDFGRFGLDLLNIDGFLSLVQIAAHQCVVVVNMWTLKDHASESWICSHYNLDYKVYPPAGRAWLHFETLAVKNGEILIRSDQKLYVCNLKWGTSKVLESKTYKEDSTFFSHDICLSSLKNCKRVIRIGNRNMCRDCERIDEEEK